MANREVHSGQDTGGPRVQREGPHGPTTSPEQGPGQPCTTLEQKTGRHVVFTPVLRYIYIYIIIYIYIRDDICKRVVFETRNDMNVNHETLEPLVFKGLGPTCLGRTVHVSCPPLDILPGKRRHFGMPSVVSFDAGSSLMKWSVKHRSCWKLLDSDRPNTSLPVPSNPRSAVGPKTSLWFATRTCAAPG